MEQREFTSISGTKYREKKTSIVELLSMASYYDTDDYEKVNKMNEFALEHLEVNIKDVWLPVKKRGFNNLTPASLEEDIAEVYDITNWYLNEVMKPVFQKSIESMKKRSSMMENQ